MWAGLLKLLINLILLLCKYCKYNFCNLKYCYPLSGTCRILGTPDVLESSFQWVPNKKLPFNFIVLKAPKNMHSEKGVFNCTLYLFNTWQSQKTYYMPWKYDLDEKKNMLEMPRAIYYNKINCFMKNFSYHLLTWWKEKKQSKATSVQITFWRNSLKWQLVSRNLSYVKIKKLTFLLLDFGQNFPENLLDSHSMRTLTESLNYIIVNLYYSNSTSFSHWTSDQTFSTINCTTPCNIT